MQYPFEMKTIDHEVYDSELRDFLPQKIIDIHSHVWLNRHQGDSQHSNRLVTWPSLVAPENPVEDHLECYHQLFPDKVVTPMIFTTVITPDNCTVNNNYISESAGKYNLPSLYFSYPEMPADILEENILKGGFLGIKVYLSLSPSYIPGDEIRIYDYLPPHQLELMNNHGWIVMLHIPRSSRLKDPVNLAQMVEIDERYPNLKLIIAHVGRAYCKEDAGDAFEILSKTKRMFFDFSANTNAFIFESLINSVGPERILFGSDLPILRMRMKRVCVDGKYINVVPKGLYGDVSYDPNMKEVLSPEADELTFFMYEELCSFKAASMRCGLGTDDIENIFYNNSKDLINSIMPIIK